MNAIEFLSRPLEARKRLTRAEQWRDSLQSLTERVTTRFGLASEPVSHSRNNAAMQDAIVDLTEAKEQVSRLEQELAAVELEVGKVLARLSDELMYKFMVARFLDLMTIEAAADSVGYTYSWGRWELDRGVAEVQRILDEMEANGKIPQEPEE